MVKRHLNRLCVVLLAIIPAMGGIGGEFPRHAVAAAASVPAGLPTHFAVGLFAHDDSTGMTGWMPNSGIPWDYSYISVSDGVNTGRGWETWWANAMFPIHYGQVASSHNYTPVFVYYEMYQSNGSCTSCSEPQKALSNMNNVSTMSSYFQNFKLLMQRLGTATYGGVTGYGKTAVVDVEPDLSGYVQRAALNNSAYCFGFCAAQGNNPSYVNAAVASTGVTEVQGYPNTFQGYSWALLHLRDLYAPNVKLAFHVSDWSTGVDIGNQTSSTINAGQLGQQVGSFAAQSGTVSVPLGTTPYDLLFNDVNDRDAGQYKYALGNPTKWWDALNVTFPNFQRWEAYIAAASQAAGRSVVLWQVPEGNQYFASLNNTNGHYQDNRAQYFFDHIAELVQSGVVGMLFGQGNSGSTMHSDAMGDGVTNPTSFCTSDGLSSGQICNNHVSSVSDDDGGYIRMRAQQYYASGGYPLSGGSTATSTPTLASTPSASTTPTLAPSPAPTNTPTVTPVPTVSTATPVPTATGVLATTISCPAIAPSVVPRGTTMTLASAITANQSLANSMVSFEIYNAAGSKVYQTYKSPVSLPANVAQTVTGSWAVPITQATGTYSVKVLVFGPNWTPLYATQWACATWSVS